MGKYSLLDNFYYCAFQERLPDEEIKVPDNLKPTMADQDYDDIYDKNFENEQIWPHFALDSFKIE
ncbi:hypothetical protein O9G_001636 [Rozella allomycis CSF55]|uniref:Uncharacterized protein n=1 Tax=Rozella allomycis (strain CSF55) TaxID=988480 RepID=A0A075ASY5_ROZAC|nr:hypothetical protein O9G_001636 [Rozella allomycis CSF55]|eukprot:EPZ33285.1 hypothetical protein O9G_001636 [Rozella allomycis CSF55]